MSETGHGTTTTLEKAASNESMDLKQIVDWSICSLLPLTALTIIFGVMSDSLTIYTIAFDSGLSLLGHFFNYASIRTIIRQNTFQYPYGTGKLENFSSFFYGSLVIPTALFFLFSAYSRFTHPPVAIHFGLTQVPIIPSIIRSIWLMFWITRLIRRHSLDSPMMHSYFVNFKITLVSDIAVSAGLLFALIMSLFDFHTLALSVDSALSAGIALYMLYNGINLTVRNFKSLIDLPLPEEDQLKILNALTLEFDAYENIGNIYTRFSGKKRLIQVELFFKAETPLSELEDLRNRISGHLKKHFEEMEFHMIPLQVS